MVPLKLPNQLTCALVDEARHRHANELASALASLHLLKAKTAPADAMLDEAIARLEAAVRLERHLLDSGTADLHGALLKLCALISVSRTSNPRFEFRVRRRPFLRDPAQMKLVLLMAYELMVNAAKHAIAFDDPIRIWIDIRESELRLTVWNRIPDCTPFATAKQAEISSTPKGAGTHIVRSMAEHLQGSFKRRMLKDAALSRVAIPFLLGSNPLAN